MQGVLCPLHFFCGALELSLIMEESQVIETFRSLLREVDSVFSGMGKEYPDEVRCKSGCVDCCYACFDMGFLEAFYLYRFFLKPPDNKHVLVQISEQAAEAKEEIGRNLAGLPADSGREEKLDAMARWRVRCPLLGKDDTCIGYEFRPITCRVYGVPTSIDGTGHVCGFSGFDMGQTYPTVKLDTIALHLQNLSRQLAQELDCDQALASRRFFLYEVVTDFERLISGRKAAAIEEGQGW